MLTTRSMKVRQKTSRGLLNGTTRMLARRPTLSTAGTSTTRTKRPGTPTMPPVQAPGLDGSRYSLSFPPVEPTVSVSRIQLDRRWKNWRGFRMVIGESLPLLVVSQCARTPPRGWLRCAPQSSSRWGSGVRFMKRRQRRVSFSDGITNLMIFRKPPTTGSSVTKVPVAGAWIRKYRLFLRQNEEKIQVPVDDMAVFPWVLFAERSSFRAFSFRGGQALTPPSPLRLFPSTLSREDDTHFFPRRLAWGFAYPRYDSQAVSFAVQLLSFGF